MHYIWHMCLQLKRSKMVSPNDCNYFHIRAFQNRRLKKIPNMWYRQQHCMYDKIQKRVSIQTDLYRRWKMG